MSKLRVHAFSMSIDGYGAGPVQIRDDPLGRGGGVSTIRPYLQERLIDELHIAITPVLLGSGEHLMGGIDLPSLGYACAEYVPSKKATHVVLRRGA